MKIKKLMMTACCVAAAMLSVTPIQALTSIQIQEIKKSVLSVPVPEMPAKAAEIVLKAEKKDRQAVAITAVRAVVSKHRAAAPIVISAVTRVAPEVAPAVAVAAVEIAADQAPAIARAAAVSAPAQAPEIAAAVTKAAPAEAASIAASVEPVIVSTRASASSNPTFIRIDNRPINPDTGGGGNGTFPTTPPIKAQPGVTIYNTPRAE